MSVWIREWKKYDIEKVAKSLLVLGLLNAECFACHNVGLSKDVKQCPDCGVKFDFIGFRNKTHPKDLDKQAKDRGLVIIEFEDFLKEFKRKKAKGLFK